MKVAPALCLIAWTAAPSSAQSLMRRDSAGGRKGAAPLQSALQELLGSVPAERLFSVEASVRPEYEAFPKNSRGQLPPNDIFAGIVRAYFAKEHGWVLKGLEPPHMVRSATSVPQADVLLRKAPRLARELKMSSDADRGLSLSDVVGTIASIEHLLLDETQTLLKAAYSLNGQPTDVPADREAFDEVLRSFVLLHRHGLPLNLTNTRLHRRIKTHAKQAEDWKELVRFVSEATAGDAGSEQSFEKALRIAKVMALDFGKWQNSECAQMKDNLMAIGSNVTGRVPLESFRAEAPHATYQFTESTEYLQQEGMLDESVNGTKEVLIANYLLGRSNCIASSAFYSVCCLSECEAIMSELERRAGTSQLPPGRLAELATQVPSSSVVAPRNLAALLVEELQAIATRHDGAVSLHSADFKHFLHQAFPNECPLPTPMESLAEEAERANAEQWLLAQQECTRIPQWHPSKWGDHEAVVNI